MQNSKSKIQKLIFGNRGVFVLFCLVYLMIGALPFCSQSTDQNYPTPIVSNEISGIIKARDIGDSRLTNYFFSFGGTQGDIFINVHTINFSGDIDVFAVDGLKPLTKITIYADLSDNETGRVVYLRKPEKLLLRIEGRSPNDDAATFQIKFAGSFAAVTDAEKIEAPAAPVVRSENNSDVIVNSVGTIIGTKPKPVPSPKAMPEPPRETVKEIAVVKNDEKTVIAENKKSKKKPAAETEKPETVTSPDVPATNDTPVEKPEKTDAEIAKNNPISGRKKTPPASGKKPVRKNEEDQPANDNAEKAAIAEKEKISKAAAEKNKRAKREETRQANRAAKREEVKEENKEAELTSALANITLKILFKDGTKIERPMSEVLKVSVDKGILTVITKDGAIGRYSVLDLTKFMIE